MPTRTPKQSDGFTLLEVMIAMVIFSIGLLGLAGLMAQSTSYNNSAQFRTQATFLAYDMLDRMRANRLVASPQLPDVLLYNMDFSVGTPAGTETCYAITCTPAALATADKAQWLTSVQSLLPSGDGSVTHDSSSGTTTVFIINISWVDPVGGSTSFLLRSEI